ncbi:MAG: saccharopine dehydrogenase [Draconibacterium sp.]|nr:MAG: saccharopine dehydrogenase [Draconibacterium sp.]
MKRILILGAGRSSRELIAYLLKNTQEYDWNITIADYGKIDFAPNERLKIKQLDINIAAAREKEVKNADLVISMLPARFHLLVAESCIKFSKNMLTASYETEEMKSLEHAVQEKGLFFLNECGLDPGIDHMSAMKIIDRIKSDGGELVSFESFTGGLVAPESDDNPWHYKFSWNPRNVVMAGHNGPARFIQNGKFKYIPYHRLFRRTELIEIEDYGWFEGYANRDSMKYIEKYHLQGIPTIYRGTLRRPGFSRAWNIFVQLGATDDSYLMKDVENMTNREFINSFLYYHPTDSVELKLYHYMHIDHDSDIIQKLNWLGIFSNDKIGLKEGTPAQILEHILKKKWLLHPEDKDMIVMWHCFEYREKGADKISKLSSSLVVKGENSEDTAMAKTVGLPLGVAAKLYLTGRFNLKGMFLPTIPEIYLPILDELENNGIQFKEKIECFNRYQ